MKPKGMCQAAKQLVAAIVMNDRFYDDVPEGRLFNPSSAALLQCRARRRNDCLRQPCQHRHLQPRVLPKKWH